MDKSKITKTSLILLSMVIVSNCIAIGFSAWTIKYAGITDFFNMFADADVYGAGAPRDLDVVTILSINKYEYATGYGFVSDDAITSSTELTGTCHCDVINAKNCFSSFRSDKSFDLEFEITTSLGSGFLANGLGSNYISLSSNSFETILATPESGAKISTTFTIAVADDTSDFDFDFAIDLRHVDSTISFPNMAAANITVKLTPKESSNEASS